MTDPAIRVDVAVMNLYRWNRLIFISILYIHPAYTATCTVHYRECVRICRSSGTTSNALEYQL